MQPVITQQEAKEKGVTKVICIDYLELSMTKKLPIVLSNHECWLNDKSYIIRFENHNKTFDSAYLLFIDGIKIGELKCNPQYSHVSDDTVHLKIDNQLLYSVECRAYIDYIIHELKFVYSHITRIDIAIDSTEFDVLSFMKKYMNSTHIKAKGRKKSIRTNFLDKLSQTVYFGSASSSKQIRIYSKLPEIQHSGKDYILDFYNVNGLNYNNAEVQRVELCLRTKNTKNIELEKLMDANYQASICRTHFKNYFEFIGRYREHNKWVKKNVTPINLNGFVTILLPKVINASKHSTKAYKTFLKGLYILALHEEYIQSQSLQSGLLMNDSLDAYTHLMGSIHRILQLKPTLKIFYDSNIKKWQRQAKNNF